MATISANVYTTNQDVTIRESLDGKLHRMAPYETKFISLMTSIRSDKLNGPYFDWPRKERGTPAGTGALRQEGHQTSLRAALAKTRETNVCSLFEDNASVSKTEAASNPAGVADVLGDEIHDKTLLLKRSLEQVAIGKQSRHDGGASANVRGNTNPRIMEGYSHFLRTNVFAGSGYVAPTNAYTDLTAGTARAFSKTILDNAIITSLSRNCKANQLLMSYAHKFAFAGFAPRNGVQTQITDTSKLIAGGITVYESDGGPLWLFPSPDLSDEILGVDKDDTQLAYLRELDIYDIPLQGSATAKAIEIEVGLQVSNEANGFKIADLL